MSDQNKANELEHAVQLESLATQRNMFGNQLALANGRIAVLQAEKAELEKKLNELTKKEPPQNGE